MRDMQLLLLSVQICMHLLTLVLLSSLKQVRDKLDNSHLDMQVNAACIHQDYIGPEAQPHYIKHGPLHVYLLLIYINTYVSYVHERRNAMSVQDLSFQIIFLKVIIYSATGTQIRQSARYLTGGELACARTYLQLPLWQWGAGNVYLLVLST